MAGTGGRPHWPSDGEKLCLKQHFVALGVHVMTTKVADARRAHLWTGVRVASYCRRPPGGSRNVSIYCLVIFPSHNRYGYYFGFIHLCVFREWIGRASSRGEGPVHPPTPWPSSHQSRDSCLLALICVSLHMSWGVTPSLPSLRCLSDHHSIGTGRSCWLLLGHLCRDSLNSFPEYWYK